MLPKSLRLKENTAFQKVFRQGKPFFFNGLGCRVLGGYGDMKIGFSISKKMYSRAVDRNRAKRLLSDAVYKHLHDIPTDTGLIFFLSKKPETLDNVNIEHGVTALIRNMR
ncbi:MAG: ribonuclease P protein component [Candidatus Moranbacteria bacterium]|nr:ribonuclease P protein component [Candidatus Moranbacteria bacterium]